MAQVIHFSLRSMSMQFRPSKVLLVGVTLAAGLGFSTAYAQFFRHPHLRAADQAADAAIQQMQTAHNGDDWFGGHRVRAIQLLQQAREQMRLSARFADHHHD